MGNRVGGWDCMGTAAWVSWDCSDCSTSLRFVGKAVVGIVGWLAWVLQGTAACLGDSWGFVGRGMQGFVVSWVG